MLRVRVFYYFRDLVPVQSHLAQLFARFDSYSALTNLVLLFLYVSHFLACLFFIAGRSAAQNWMAGFSSETGWIVYVVTAAKI